MSEKKHFLDKPILRDLFWFVVLPYRLEQDYLAPKYRENIEDEDK